MNLSLKYDIILIGDTHGFLNDFKIQKRIIGAVKPEFVLMESLEDKRFLSQDAIRTQLRKRKFTKTTQFGEVKNILAYALQKKIKLIGIDIKNFGLGDIDLKNPSKQEESYLRKLLPQREKRQLSVIRSCLKKTKRPLIVVTGSYHLRKNSLLIKGLQDKSLILICPSYNGKLLYQPVKNKKAVTYKIKCLNSKE